MKNMIKISNASGHISRREISAYLESLCETCKDNERVLLIPPDISRLNSFGGVITALLYEKLCCRCHVKIMPAVGTHIPMSKRERMEMFGTGIPDSAYLEHDWQRDTVCLGIVPAEFVAEISENAYLQDIEAELNANLVNGRFHHVISIGQVVPHEIVGMANYSKNIFVGVGGRNMINKTHFLGALYGTERMMGKTDTPVRSVFSYAHEHFLRDIQITFILTVVAMEQGGACLKGLFMGKGQELFRQACRLSQQVNITYLNRKVGKIVSFLDPREFKSTWVGNKAVYRTNMALEDGGELIVLAPGIEVFGENRDTDANIRRYGYKGREYILDLYKKEKFKGHEMDAAHLIQGSSNGRYQITYAVDPKRIPREAVEQIGYRFMDIREALEHYGPGISREGYNDTEEGYYYVGAPALGLLVAER